MAGHRRPVTRTRRANRKKPASQGREPMWRKEDVRRVCAQVQELVGTHDMTDAEVAEFYGMSQRSLYRYKVRYPELARAMVRAEDHLVRLVERKLIHSAVGYRQRAIKIMQYEGDPVIVEYEEHIQPSVAAQQAFLKAKKPAEYSDKMLHGGDPRNPVRLVIDGLDVATEPPKEEEHA